MKITVTLVAFALMLFACSGDSSSDNNTGGPLLSCSVESFDPLLDVRSTSDLFGISVSSAEAAVESCYVALPESGQRFYGQKVNSLQRNGWSDHIYALYYSYDNGEMDINGTKISFASARCEEEECRITMDTVCTVDGKAYTERDSVKILNKNYSPPVEKRELFEFNVDLDETPTGKETIGLAIWQSNDAAARCYIEANGTRVEGVAAGLTSEGNFTLGLFTLDYSYTAGDAYFTVGGQPIALNGLCEADGECEMGIKTLCETVAGNTYSDTDSVEWQKEQT